MSLNSSSKAFILDGKQIASDLNTNTKKSTSLLSRPPKLVIIQVGGNEDSSKYINSKLKLAESLGIEAIKYTFDEDQELKVLEKIYELNEDKSVDAILPQLPLPASFDEKRLINSISSEKDCDGLHPVNVAKLNLLSKLEDHLSVGADFPIPVTARGILHLIKIALEKTRNTKSLEGLNVVIVGRSELVGKPTAALMLLENATLTVCHSKTKDLQSHTKNADILISAAGCPGLINSKMIKSDSILIDVGLTYLADTNGVYKAVGDILFEECSLIASAITPVPGGVGPLTVAMLMDNVLKIAEVRKEVK